MTWIAARLDGKPIDIDKIDSLEEWQKPDLEVKVNKNGAWMRPFRFGADFSGIATLEDRSPAILLQAPRNVRQHLHDGLGFVDDTVDAMAAATPEVMDDVTGQILKVLADSKDYSDAKQRLLAAFPTFDRSQLRNMLTGGILIAQAMGMESVQRETAGEKVLRMSAGLPHLPRILPL